MCFTHSQDEEPKKAKQEKTPADEKKDEAEKKSKKILKEKEVDRICRHVLDVASEYGSLPGTGNLVPAFRHFDPRGRGAVPARTANDVLAFLGCNLVDEEGALLWSCLDGCSDAHEVDYAQLDGFVALRAGHLAHAPDSPLRQTQQQTTFTSPHVSFANTPSHASRFSLGPPHPSAGRAAGRLSAAQSTQRPPRGSGREGDDEALLTALARGLVAAGQAEAAAWGQPSFDAEQFFGLRCGPEGGVEEVAAACEKLGVALTREEAAALDGCFGRGSGGVDCASFALFVDRAGGGDAGKDPRSRLAGHGRPGQRGDAARSSAEGSGSEGELPPAVASLLRVVGPTILAQQRLGLDAAMTFEMHDPGETGRCSVDAFVEAMRQLDLRMSLDQLQLLVDAFASGDSSVDYRAFLKHATHATHGGLSARAQPQATLPSSRLATGGRLAPLLDPLRAPWDPGVDPSPYARSFDSGLPPRRPALEAPTLQLDTYAGGHVFSSGGALSSPSRSAAVAIWGAGTPLQQRGTIPTEVKSQLASAGKWMCLTCLFADNTPRNARCDVCGAGNPTGCDVDVQQECPSCHFFNSPFCAACDMCHRPLHGHAPPVTAPESQLRSKVDEASFALHRAPPSGRHRKDAEVSGWAYGSDSD